MSPATALMGAVGMTYKFILVGVIVFFSLLFGTASLYTALNKSINNTQKELSGLDLINTTTRAIQLLQQHRGITTSLASRLSKKEVISYGKPEECFAALEYAEQNLPNNVEIKTAFSEIKSTWNSLESNGATLAPEVNFAQHTQLIKKVLRFQVQLADHYALTLDPDFDTYYLVEIGLKNLPAYLEHLAQLRGLGTGILVRQKTTLADKSGLISRLEQARDSASEVRVNLKKLGVSNPTLREHMGISSHRIEQMTRQVEDLIEADLLSEKFSLGPGTYFKILTVAIDQAYIELSETYSADLKQLLENRLEYQSSLLTFNLAGTTISLLLTLYFAMGTFLVVTHSTHEIIASANDFSAGNLARKVNVSSNDELGAIGESFNQMAADLSNLYGRLDEAQKRASNIIETALDAVVQINKQGEIIGWNQQAELIFGWPSSEVLGKMVHETIVPHAHREAHIQGMQHFLATGQGTVLGKRIEISGLHRDGHEFPIELAITPNQANGAHEFSAFIRDITKLKTAQLELQDALKRAELANSAKSTFLANMSHEIRTPINAVLGYSLIAQRRAMPENILAFFQKIHTAGQGLLHVINDILDFSKIEAGKLEMEITSFEPEVILSNVADLLAPRAREKGIELVMGVMPGVPPQLTGDPLRLAQVLTNLLSNAIKFTAEGEVTLLVENIGGDEKQAVLSFVVKDTGIGMNQQQLNAIFQPFVQADSSTTRNFGGTGLGLVISQQIVKMMGGEIAVTSIEGKGSQFQFSVGFGLPTDKQVNLSLFTGKQVLIVDDNALMRRLLAKTTESFGTVVQEVASGEDALALIHTGFIPDCVLMDLHLSGINGLETVRQMKALGTPTPAVLVTAEDRDLIRDEAALICEKIVSKPVSRSVLHETLLSIFSGRSSIQDRGKLPNTIPNLSGKRILLVDDNQFNREIGCDLIEITNANVDTAIDGAEAVQAVLSQPYDLVFMDIQMPVMDGYSAVKAIRGKGISLPIIGLTAHAMAEDKVKVLSAGMNDFLSKPIVTNKLYSVLEKWIGQSSGSSILTPSKATTHQIHPLPTRQDDLRLASMRGFDTATAIERLGGNSDKYKRYLAKFLKHNINNLADITAALVEPDIAKAKRLAHSLKGVAGTLGAVDLESAAAIVEKYLANPDVAPTAFLSSAEMSSLTQQWDIAIRELGELGL